MRETVEALDRTTTAVGEGLNLAVSRIDADLTALDERVDRRRRECETNEAVLELYKARLEELEKLFDAQSLRMAELESKIDMVACRCGSSDENKENEEAVSVLESPIILQDSPTSASSSISSYLAPPVANEPSTSSLTLVADENQENESRLGIGARIALGRMDRLPGLLSSPREYVREVQAITQEHSADIIGVRGQRAFRSLGPPKSRFRPYSVIPRRSGRKHRCESCRDSVDDGSADDEHSSV